MKILHAVEQYHPSVGGMQEVVRQLSERLVSLGHEVTVATTRLTERSVHELNGVRIVEFSVSGNFASGMSGEIETYREFVIDGDFDVITNFAAQQWTTDALLPLLPRLKGVKVFVPTGFSGLYDPRYRDYFTQMKFWLRQYDMNVFLSEVYRDIQFARDSGVENFVIIPNGAAEEEFLPTPKIDIRARLHIPREHLLLLHVGSHTGGKGHAETIEIFRTARIRRATLLMVANSFGGGCSEACASAGRWNRFRPDMWIADKRLIVREFSRPETLAAYHAADLMLFPSNIECSPLVLFEAMASRTPFLTTDVGNAAEIVRWSEGGVVLPTVIDAGGRSRAIIASGSKILEEMAKDRTRRAYLAENGFRAWYENFSWRKIALRYEKLYTDLAGCIKDAK